jgi:hypothetical protein
LLKPKQDPKTCCPKPTPSSTHNTCCHLIQAGCEPLGAEEAKEIENLAGGIRADKVKAEKAAAAAKKGGECCRWYYRCCSRVVGVVGFT